MVWKEDNTIKTYKDILKPFGSSRCCKEDEDDDSHGHWFAFDLPPRLRKHLNTSMKDDPKKLQKLLDCTDYELIMHDHHASICQ